MPFKWHILYLIYLIFCYTNSPRGWLASCKSASNPAVVYSTDSSKAVVPVLVLLFVALWFILRGDSLAFCYFVLVFFSPFSIVITSLGEETANLSAIRTFVRFALDSFCLFPLPLGVWERLRLVIVALPGLFSYLFEIIMAHCYDSQITDRKWESWFYWDSSWAIMKFSASSIYMGRTPFSKIRQWPAQWSQNKWKYNLHFYEVRGDVLRH